MFRDAAARLMEGVDEVFTQGALVAPRKEPYEPVQRMREIEAFLASLPEDFGRDVEAFFPGQPREPFTPRVLRELPEGKLVELRAKVRHRVFFEDEAEAFRAMPKSRVAIVRHFRHQRRFRPALILIHGFMAGDFALEEREWPTHRYYKSGLDVVLACLPGHGARKSTRPWQPPDWPARTPTFTIEGYRQAIGELRGVVSHLLEDGCTHVAVMGMSLGGYTAALLATVEPRLCLVAPFIPLASTADFMRDNGQLRGSAVQVAKQHALVERMFESVSPLARPCLVPKEGRMVFGGQYDRVTPLGHADRIAAHFGVDTTVFPGAHILQYGRWEAFAAVTKNLRARGILRA